MPPEQSARTSQIDTDPGIVAARTRKHVRAQFANRGGRMKKPKILSRSTDHGKLSKLTGRWTEVVKKIPV
jgi:hypothetical protein